MTTAKRVFSGTVATWARIGVTMLSQIVLVPLLLTYWDLPTYGAWLAVQAVVSLLSTWDRAFCDYSEYECLKVGADNKPGIAHLLWSALLGLFLMGVVELGLVATLAMQSDRIAGLREAPSLTGTAVTAAFLMQWVTWGITNAVGLFSRLMSVFGFYARMAWWGVLIAVLQSVAPIGAVMAGGGIVAASLWTAALVVPLLGLQLVSILRALRAMNVPLAKPSLALGLRHVSRSAVLALRYFLDNFKHQGIRLLIAPALGVAPLATFTTTRTGANVMMQGLATVMHPMLPELMRFMHQRNQRKLEMTFDTVWFIIIAAMAPGVVLVQSVGAFVFASWTNGKIAFNPLLFALLSMSILVYALAQVPLAILNGNNLLRKQLVLSVTGCAVLLGLLLSLLTPFGLTGAGLALLASEAVGAIISIRMAGAWLENHGLHWPHRKSRLVSLSIGGTALGLTAMSLWPGWLVPVMLGTLLFLLAMAIVYWRAMDQSATATIRQLLSRYVYRFAAR